MQSSQLAEELTVFISLAVVVGLSTGLSDFVEMMVVDRSGDDASIYLYCSEKARAWDRRQNTCVIWCLAKSCT